MNSNVLNEAILDDGQAIYRGYSMYKRLEKSTDVNITASELKEKIALLSGNPSAPTIEEAFTWKTRLKKQPLNIVFILGENYALWPFCKIIRTLSGFHYEWCTKLRWSLGIGCSMLAFSGFQLEMVDGFTGLVSV